MKAEPPSKWDTRFFEVCDLVATWSEDRSRKIGAVIVGTANQILATGYNGFPRGVTDANPRHDRENGEKYLWFEHAERNAIYNAARSGVSVENARIYSSVFPCADCARAIVQAGLAELYTEPPPVVDENFDRSYEVAEEILNEAQIEIRFIERSSQ